MAIQTITPPDGGLLTLAEAKAHLRIEHTDDDDLIAALILAVGDAIEDHTQRKYLAQELLWIRNHWADPMRLPIAPNGDSSNISIGTILFASLQDGTMIELDPSIYWVRPHGPTVELVKRWFVIWPWLGDAPQRIQIPITITPPVDNDGAVIIPNRVKQAARLLLSHFFRHADAVVGVENRDSSTELPLGVSRLLASEQWD